MISGMNKLGLPLASWLARLPIDPILIIITSISIHSRTRQIESPSVVVFNEAVYSQYVLLLNRQKFFFDSQPPLGKLILAYIAQAAANLTRITEDVEAIGSNFPTGFPFTQLRYVTAICGALLPSFVYKILTTAGFSVLSSVFGSILILCETGLEVHCQFFSSEPLQLLFIIMAVFMAISYREGSNSRSSYMYLCLTSFFLSMALSTKFSSIYTGMLIVGNLFYDTWQLLDDPKISVRRIIGRFIVELIATMLLPFLAYLLVFGSFLASVHRWGPQSHLMSTMYQSTFKEVSGKNPVVISWGSQLTLRSDSFTPCWLQSSDKLYPAKYSDGRGSSHQAAVYCADRKTAYNWWIIMKPNDSDSRDNHVHNNEVVLLRHGMTGNLLNSHDVAGPVSLGCQEVSGYIDHFVEMEPETLWRLEILNTDSTELWYQIKSIVQLVHINSQLVLKLSGRKLPEWGDAQLEVIADKDVGDKSARWTVEEVKRKIDQSPITTIVHYSYWSKLLEIHHKMLWPTYMRYSDDAEDIGHLYESNPYEWLSGDSIIVYWQNSTASLKLVPNSLVYTFATVMEILFVVVYIVFSLRSLRGISDLSQHEIKLGLVSFRYFFLGHVVNYLPYWFYDPPVFIHDYFAALIFQVLLAAAAIDSLMKFLRSCRFLQYLIVLVVIVITFVIFATFNDLIRFESLSR